MKTVKVTSDDRDRFMRRVKKVFAATASVQGPCWLWQGRLHTAGYGLFDIHDKAMRAHRVAYELFVGPIPPGKVLDHLCRVRKCVAPHHLELVTQQENIRRGENHVAERMRTTHCPSGHPYTEENTYRDGLNRRYCRTCRRIRARQRRAA